MKKLALLSVVIFLFGCETTVPTEVPANPDLILSFESPPSGALASSVVVIDSRPSAERQRVMLPRGIRFGDSDFRVAPARALEANIAAFIETAPYGEKLASRLRAGPIELIKFEITYEFADTSTSRSDPGRAPAAAVFESVVAASIGPGGPGRVEIVVRQGEQLFTGSAVVEFAGRGYPSGGDLQSLFLAGSRQLANQMSSASKTR